MIDENILENIISLPEEDEEMENIQRELEEADFPITSFKKGGVFYHLIRLLVKIFIELKELARTILSACFIKHAQGDWLEIKAADYSKSRKEAIETTGYITIYRNDNNFALQIKKGHGFKTEANHAGVEYKFYALEDTIIPAGAEIGRVLVVAEAGGSQYNLPSNKINISLIHMEGVEHVTNEGDWIVAAGTEIEDLESLRERCLSGWSELSTRTIKEKLINVAQEVPGVLYANINDRHPRGQATVDIVITGVNGGANEELLKQVTEAIEPLQGSYEDYLVKSSEVIQQDFEIIVYLSRHSSTDGIPEQATTLMKEMMRLTRGELNTLYRDSIIKALSNNIGNYLKSDIVQPATDVQYEKDKIIVVGDINITVKSI